MKLDRQRLYRLRKYFHWTQVEAANQAGVSTQAYSRAECGYGIRKTTAEAIVHAFQRQLTKLEQNPDPIEGFKNDIQELATDHDEISLETIAEPF
jgi:transcriptional regulator with XRE-family HTH domain